MQEKIRVAILGGTGIAGREALLHQQFLDDIGLQYAEVTCVTAGPNSVGRRLGEVVSEKENALADAYYFWKPMKCPESLRDIIIDPTEPEIIASKADYAVSALGSDIARIIEPKLTVLGVNVFSNASSYRWDPKVPLLVPEVNYKHLKLIEGQETPGKHVCDTNCTLRNYAKLVSVLEESWYKIKNIEVYTRQALSGKGDEITKPKYVEKALNASEEGFDDWGPNTNSDEKCSAEEWKCICEPQKVWGKVKTKEEVIEERAKVLRGETSKIIPIYAETRRVKAQHGHLEYLTIEFDQRVKVEEIRSILENHTFPKEVANLPTTPAKLFYVMNDIPKRERDLCLGNGMSVIIGNMQQEEFNKISLWTLTHNLRGGATWAGRQGLELFLYQYKSMFNK